MSIKITSTLLDQFSERNVVVDKTIKKEEEIKQVNSQFEIGILFSLKQKDNFIFFDSISMSNHNNNEFPSTEEFINDLKKFKKCIGNIYINGIYLKNNNLLRNDILEIYLNNLKNVFNLNICYLFNFENFEFFKFDQKLQKMNFEKFIVDNPFQIDVVTCNLSIQIDFCKVEEVKDYLNQNFIFDLKNNKIISYQNGNFIKKENIENGDNTKKENITSFNGNISGLVHVLNKNVSKNEIIEEMKKELYNNILQKVNEKSQNVEVFYLKFKDIYMSDILINNDDKLLSQNLQFISEFTKENAVKLLFLERLQPEEKIISLQQDSKEISKEIVKETQQEKNNENTIMYFIYMFYLWLISLFKKQ
ncbi:hypothetical protein ABK040_001617 [Willaertia magna]